MIIRFLNDRLASSQIYAKAALCRVWRSIVLLRELWPFFLVKFFPAEFVLVAQRMCSTGASPVSSNMLRLVNQHFKPL
jgi:hypothetical protein